MLNYKIDIPECGECPYVGQSFFCDLKHSDLDKLSEHKSHILFKKGQIIFFEGNFPHGLYCIHEGKVKISKLGEGGKEQIVRFASRNEIIGYRSLLSGESYNATATVLEDTQVCFIAQDVFSDMIRNNSDFSLKAIKLLSDDLKQAEEKVLNMAQKRVNERVAESILILKECFGFIEDNETINANILRRDIASIAGTTTETAIRMVSELNEDGIINSSGKKIRILDMPRLTKTANVLD